MNQKKNSIPQPIVILLICLSAVLLIALFLIFIMRDNDREIEDDNPPSRQSESDSPADESQALPETLLAPNAETPLKEPEPITPPEP